MVVDVERSLLLECLLSAAEARPALRALPAALRPERLVTLARRWAVSETAAHALLAAGALDRLGARAAGDLRSDLENATAGNALLLAEAARLQAALRARGVASVAMKGAALVAAHYPGVGARHVADLDLLVHPDDALRAGSVLQELGCTPVRAPLPDLDGRSTAGVLPAHQHAPALRTPGGNVCELHHALPGSRGGAAATADVLDRGRDVPWRGAMLRLPSVDDLLGMCCAHALGHHGADVRFVPRHVADVAVLLRDGAGAARAALLCPGAEVARSLELVAAARAARGSAIFPRARAWPPLARARAALAATIRSARRGELRRNLFPARAYLASRYGVAARSPLLPLLWAWRPVRALLRIAAGR